MKYAVLHGVTHWLYDEICPIASWGLLETALCEIRLVSFRGVL